MADDLASIVTMLTHSMLEGLYLIERHTTYVLESERVTRKRTCRVFLLQYALEGVEIVHG